MTYIPNALRFWVEMWCLPFYGPEPLDTLLPASWNTLTTSIRAHVRHDDKLKLDLVLDLVIGCEILILVEDIFGLNCEW